MFIAVSENLPKTSYIKMVDIWLIFNLMIPFFEVTTEMHFACYLRAWTRFFLPAKTCILLLDISQQLISDSLEEKHCVMEFIKQILSTNIAFCPFEIPDHFISDFQVLLHTFIDSLRIDESREINHHGKPRKVHGKP